jgi:hypothetical protein
MRSWVLPVAALLVLPSACGPSFQAIYEGDARFEHCYALDDDPNVPMQRKSECWQDWTQHYTFGQTRDRVEYATMRFRALARVPEAPTDEAMMGAAPGEGSRSSSITAPAPTSAFAPPPKTMEETRGSRASQPPPTIPTASATPPTPAVDAGTSPVPPKTECVDACSNDWQNCKASCAGRTCGACDKTYGRCVKACF